MSYDEKQICGMKYGADLVKILKAHYDLTHIRDSLNAVIVSKADVKLLLQAMFLGAALMPNNIFDALRRAVFIKAEEDGVELRKIIGSTSSYEANKETSVTNTSKRKVADGENAMTRGNDVDEEAIQLIKEKGRRNVRKPLYHEG